MTTAPTPNPDPSNLTAHDLHIVWSALCRDLGGHHERAHATDRFTDRRLAREAGSAVFATLHRLDPVRAGHHRKVAHGGRIGHGWSECGPDCTHIEAAPPPGSQGRRRGADRLTVTAAAHART